MNIFLLEEIQLISQLFDNLILRSKSKKGIDRYVFVKYCPIPGLWGNRIYNYLKKSEEQYITFCDFINGLRCLCRANDNELDKTIWEMFDLCENKTFISEANMV
jgi:hypothetical protein